MSSIDGLRAKSLKFLIAGGVNTAVFYALYVLLIRRGWIYHLALLAEYAGGIVAGYLMNRYWTFASHGRPQRGFVKYAAAYAVVFLLNWVLLGVIVESRLLGAVVGQIAAFGVATLLSFILQNFWVFLLKARPRMNMLDRPQEYTKMAKAEGQLWWYQSLHHLVLEAIRSSYSGSEVSLLDAGCGTGGLMAFLRERGYQHLKGFDLSGDAVALCRQRELDVKPGNLLDIGGLYAASSFEVVVSNDTLCYFDARQQVDVVGQCWRILKPGGLLILNLPALDAFAGIHDVSVGIGRRFLRADVRRIFATVPFESLRETYWPFLVSPFVYLTRLKQRIHIRCHPDFRPRSDISMPARPLNAFLAHLTRLENRWLRYKPFGSSLFVVAKRLGTEAGDA